MPQRLSLPNCVYLGEELKVHIDGYVFGGSILNRLDLDGGEQILSLGTRTFFSLSSAPIPKVSECHQT